METLYQKIETLCSKKGISRAQLCRDTGISQGNITDLKMGRKESFSARRLSKIANYFGVSVDSLLSDITGVFDSENSKSDHAASDPVTEHIIKTRVALVAMAKEAMKSVESFTACYPELFSETGWKGLSQRYREKHPICERCGATPTILNVHHIRPVKYGYPTMCEDKWLASLCPACHRFVHSSANTEREFIVLPDGETL